jgi:hypothetical protein
MGVRYLSSLSVFTVLFLMIVAKALMGAILAVMSIFSRVEVLPFVRLPIGRGGTFDLYFFDLFTWLVFVAGTCHQVSIRRRIQRGEMGYTYDSGRPFMWIWGLVSHDEWPIKRFWEPGAWCFLSYAIRGVDPILSWYLFLSSFALLAKANLIYYHMRAMRWDLHDQALVGAYLAAQFDEVGGPSSASAGPVRSAPPEEAHAFLLRPRASEVLLALGLSPPASEEAAPASPRPDRIPVLCPACGQRLRASARLAGKTAPCPRCGAAIAVPADEVPISSNGAPVS